MGEDVGSGVGELVRAQGCEGILFEFPTWSGATAVACMSKRTLDCEIENYEIELSVKKSLFGDLMRGKSAAKENL
jgi:hypothetical protein